MADGNDGAGSRSGSAAGSRTDVAGERRPEGINSAGEGQKRLSNYNFDEAVLKVQEWNEALKCRFLNLFSSRDF